MLRDAGESTAATAISRLPLGSRGVWMPKRPCSERGGRGGAEGEVPAPLRGARPRRRDATASPGLSRLLTHGTPGSGLGINGSPG